VTTAARNLPEFLKSVATSIADAVSHLDDDDPRVRFLNSLDSLDWTVHDARWVAARNLLDLEREWSSEDPPAGIARGRAQVTLSAGRSPDRSTASLQVPGPRSSPRPSCPPYPSCYRARSTRTESARSAGPRSSTSAGRHRRRPRTPTSQFRRARAPAIDPAPASHDRHRIHALKRINCDPDDERLGLSVQRIPYKLAQPHKAPGGARQRLKVITLNAHLDDLGHRAARPERR
jgi:hypothetical protein